MYFIENFPEHLWRQTPCLGVVAAAVIGRKQVTVPVQMVAGAVAEGIVPRLSVQGAQHSVVGDAPQRQDHRPPRRR